jgi:hypothetical protein
MKEKYMRSINNVRCASAALALAWALVPANAGATGIVLTGGSLALDCFHEDQGCNALLFSGQVEYLVGRRGNR